MSVQARAAFDAAINGIDVHRLQGTIEAIKAAPALAKFTFRVNNKWMKGGQNRSTIQGFWGVGAYNDRDRFVIDNGEPELVLGADEAPNPLEYVLHAVVGCLTTTLVYHATLQGVRIQAIESQAEGDVDLHGFLGLRQDQSNGFQEIRTTIRVKADCSSQELAELIRIAQQRSPVRDVVVSGVTLLVACEPM
jgi:uncharacterized OsmC-like protein